MQNIYNTEKNIIPVSSYPEMLRAVKRAKKERRDNFEYFLSAAIGSGAYRLGRVIECRENVAGMALIFICTALIKYRKPQKDTRLRDDLKRHLSELKGMRTSVSVPLCVVPEAEGIMFPGEGMSLRFLNALIILESLLLAKMDEGSIKKLKNNWSMYSSLDLIINLELPALLGVLSDVEKELYAKMVMENKEESEYEEERKTAGKLILSTRSKIRTDDASETSIGIKIFGIILFLFYTILLIKFSS